MLDIPRLELATALLTAAAALTLVPHTRTRVGSTVELMVWLGFLLSSGLYLATFSDPKVHATTTAIAWGGIRLIQIQAGSVSSAVGAWTGAHRFAIANWAALVAGADVLALAFIAGVHSARKTAPRRHLAGWFEMPYPGMQPAFVPAVDPLAAIDRRLAAAAQVRLQSVVRKVETSPMIARAALRTAHVLRPGHLRLAMVKLALSIKWRQDQLGRSALPGRDQPIAGKRRQRRGHRNRETAIRTRPAAAGRVSGGPKKEGGRTGVHGLRHRVAP